MNSGRNSHTIFPEKGITAGGLFSLMAWGIIWAIGMHPDVTWGDGLGFSIAVQSGFDWATNANSHWLYLNFHHLVLQWIPIGDAIQILGWASWFWSVASLYLLFLLTTKLAGPKAGSWALHLFASCFTVWRHACIIEVYSMATFFWLLALLLFFEALNNRKSAIWLTLVHALGLLVHVQLIFLFPLILVVLWREKIPVMLRLLLPYGLPLLAIVFSVFILKTNDIPSILFDNKATEMTQGLLPRLAKGIVFIPAYMAFLFPVGMVGLAFFLFQKGVWNHWKSDPFRRMLLLVAAINFLFCLCFPETGIHVFLIPDFFIISIFIGEAMVVKFPSLSAFWLALLAPFLAGFYSVLLMVITHFQWFSQNEETAWKGGPAYYLLPWARGNATSVLEKAKEAENQPAPASLDWNFGQVKTWETIQKQP